MSFYNNEEIGLSGVSLREARAEDEPFLYELYRSTRFEEMAQWGWDPAQQDAFLRMQFAAQRRHYEAAYDGAEHTIITFDDRPIGRTIVFRSDREILLVDIALLPDRRGAGIGAALVRKLLDEAARTDRPVSLHVTKNNPARRLYERLGFEITADTGVYLRMEWRPGSASHGDVKNA